MVIPIVAMLAVTMVVAGWQYEEEQEIDVEENPGELTIEHVNEPDDETGVEGTLPEKNETGITNINEKSQLKIEVDPESIMRTSREQTVYLDFQSIGAFGENLDIETMKIEVNQLGEDEEPYNFVNFDRTEKEIDAGESWPEERDEGGVTFSSPDRSAHVGFEIDSNEFVANGRIKWHFPPENIGTDFTLQIQAMIDGNISEEVVSTVEIHIEGGD